MEWAFAIWNSRDRTLFLSRDRLGVRPLYYTQRGDQFLFASEIKALLAAIGQPARIRHESLQEYLVFRYVTGSYTFFEDVRHRCFWLATLWIFVRFYVVERVNPSKERYWKKIIREHARLAARYRRLERVDEWLLRTFPFLGRYCWNIAVVATKGGE